ncbi:TIGR04086 family membrane protein [Gracilibacillus sp. JCM 18860]|uniref:TIGR04086 family membrane protein n=1 Tax=Gracilibacillus sp. JCM 18860 TaxID=1306159 RepID=UPI000A76D929
MKTFVSVLFGWIGIFIVLFVASLILALLLRFTSFGESTMELVTLLISFLALFTGGIYCRAKSEE